MSQAEAKSPSKRSIRFRKDRYQPLPQEINIRIYEEGPILIADFAKKIGMSYNGIYAWSRLGRKSISGDIVLLEVVNTSSGIATSEAAYKRFVKLLNDIPD